jgi:hypothetical protein
MVLAAALANGAAVTHRVQIANSAPIVSGVILNHGDPITLNPNATTSVDVNFTVSDDNGCDSVYIGGGGVTTTLSRSGVSSTCGTFSNTANTLNCYVLSRPSVVYGCPSSFPTTQVSGNATATFQIYYFAQATDASSSFSAESWIAQVGVADASSTTSTASSAGVEMNTLLAVGVASATLSFGTLSPGASTTGNYPVTLINAGNASSTLQISGTALASGSNTLSTSSQHYATSTFTYGGLEQVLSAVGTAVSGLSISPAARESWISNGTTGGGGVAQSGIAAYEGYAYAIGVSTGTKVMFAPINATGSLSSWSPTTPLPSFVCAFGAFAANGYLNVVGGEPGCGGNGTSTVLSARINATGSLGAWAVTSLPDPAADIRTAVYNDYVYIAGGRDASFNQTSTVLFSHISATGTLEGWTRTSALPHNASFVGAAAGDGYLYLVGDDANFSSSTFYGQISATGSIVSWQSGPSVPAPWSTYGNILLYDNGTLYLYPSTSTGATYFLPVNGNGMPPSSTAAWSPGPSLPTAFEFPAGFAHRGYGYMFDSTNDAVFSLNLASRNTYWGIQPDAGRPTGTYSGVTTYTAVFSQ